MDCQQNAFSRNSTIWGRCLGEINTGRYFNRSLKTLRAVIGVCATACRKTHAPFNIKAFPDFDMK
jgi:hypothetical protein